MATQSFRTCRLLEVPPDRDGKARVRNRKAYRCSAPIPQPDLPDSVTKSYAFHWPPLRRWMQGDEGTSCPTFSPKAEDPTHD